MLRFFCPACGIVKRVRRKPLDLDLDDIRYNDKPTQRVAMCSRHDPRRVGTNPFLFHRIKAKPIRRPKTSAVSSSPKKSRSPKKSSQPGNRYAGTD